ncbi:MAG: tyrosine-protein kinase [Actinomycetota bacterium]|nr:tyrosine-protein kinase [Actinomycetota bacterium]MEA2972467.1 tyrosine-protein kinase [Actinomycetota bacterium]
MTEESARAVELRDYLEVLWRRKWVIVIALAVIVSIGVFRSARQTKIYRSSGQILLSVEGADNVLTQISIIQGQAIRQKVLAKVPGANGVSAARDSVRIVNVSVESPDPKVAKAGVTAYIDTYIEFRQEQRLKQLAATTEQTRTRVAELDAQVDALTEEYEAKTADIDARAVASPGESSSEQAARVNGVARDRRELDVDVKARRDALQRDQLQLESKLFELEAANDITTPAAEVVNEASTARRVRPEPVSAGMSAAVVGMVLGVALAFLFEYLDESIKTKDDVQRAVGSKVPVVATIPAITEWRDRTKTEVVSVSAPRSSAAEAYRSLRTTVQFAGLERPVNVIAITSPTAGEGKTTALANLAVVVAGAGRRVVMLDCDLRRPRIHNFFGLSNEVGFTSWMVGDAPLSAALQDVPGIRRLSLMASGPIPPNPSELLSSRRFPELVRTLQSEGALVLIDTPPLLPVTDAAVIARSIDLSFMITMAGKGTRKHLRHAMDILDQVDAPIGGIVLNGVEADRQSYYEGSYYGEAAAPPPPSQRRRPSSAGRGPKPAPRPAPLANGKSDGRSSGPSNGKAAGTDSPKKERSG